MAENKKNKKAEDKKTETAVNNKVNQEGKSAVSTAEARTFPLGKNNFLWMAISGGWIILGFLLMLGSSSTAEEFNPDIFSARRIVVGPCMAFLGFVGMAIAIIVRPKNKN